MILNGSRLIMFEGIPGSGKSTLAKRVHEYLSSNGIKTTLYSEGCDHPVDLTWHAYLTKNEFYSLTSKYIEHADQICKNSIIENDYILVPYRKLCFDPQENELIKYLEAHEICYNNNATVSIEIFTKVFRKRWEQYAHCSLLKDEITIFESAYFQHHIHDLMRLYMPGNTIIIEHLETLLKEVEELKPILFYLTQSSVKETLLRVWKQRSTPGKDSISQNTRFVENSAYGRANNLTGLDGAIQFWEDRKHIEFKAIDKLPLKTFVIDNSDYNWDKVFDKIIKILK